MTCGPFRSVSWTSSTSLKRVHYQVVRPPVRPVQTGTGTESVVTPSPPTSPPALTLLHDSTPDLRHFYPTTLLLLPPSDRLSRFYPRSVPRPLQSSDDTDVSTPWDTNPTMDPLEWLNRGKTLSLSPGRGHQDGRGDT